MLMDKEKSDRKKMEKGKKSCSVNEVVLWATTIRQGDVWRSFMCCYSWCLARLGPLTVIPDLD